MPGTYSQIYIQTVFAVKHRESLIRPEWEEELHKYIAGVIISKEQKPLAINGMHDHIHILIGMRPSCCLSDLVREVKKASNQFINDHKCINRSFGWQEGFGAFSYSHSQLTDVISYINNQKLHHKKITFKDEYIAFLQKFNVSYEEQYLFDWLDTNNVIH